ncbi:MAG: DUF2914 domain-containing protein, partial [Bdellovibrionales bacterium]
FFIGGFLFDMVMLERIDSFMTIGQQGLYLFLILAALLQMFFEELQPPPDTSKMFFIKRWFYDYRTALVHFFFGTLLNGYTLFFFKSSSLIISFIFMIFMVGLLVVNESHRFKKSGITFKFGLLSLCIFCYFAYVTPIAAGSIGTMVFLLSMFVGSLPLVLVGWWIQVYRPPLFEKAKKQILVPMGAVLVVILGLYLVRLIPPVPLSIPFIGVYHSVERVPEGYKLGHERPWWRFWQNGDQEFHAHRSDKIYVFFRIFSPTRFSDQVLMRWYWKDNKLGWTMQDSIPIKIVGGRGEGFRGFGMKSNYQPGEWKVQVETTDDREIGRVYFSLDIAPDEPRTFEYQVM